MGAMFSPASAPAVQPPPPIPGPNTAEVLAAQRDAERSRAHASGRASTILTDPETQQDPGPSRTKRALGDL